MFAEKSSVMKPLGAWLCAGLLLSAAVAQAAVGDLLRMSEQLDRLDKQDMHDLLEKAGQCTRVRDFNCAEQRLKQAGKLAKGSGDRSALQLAGANLLAEKKKQEQEILEREAKERELQLAEERLAEEERDLERRRQREANTDRSSESNTGMWLAFGATVLQNYKNLKATQALENAAASKRFNDMQAGVQASIAKDQERFAKERQRLKQEGAVLVQERNKVIQRQPQPSMPAPRPVVGAENVKLGAPTLITDRSHLGSAGAGMTNNDLAQLGAKAAGFSLADLDRKPSALPATVVTTATDAFPFKPSGKQAEQKKQEIQWGPIKLEAVAVCLQSKTNGKWSCNGPLDNEVIFDSVTVEESLKRQRCANPERVAVSAVIKGVSWDAYRCNHSLGHGDYDIAKRYNLHAIQRQFICPKDKPSDGRCKTLYDGQDRR